MSFQYKYRDTFYCTYTINEWKYIFKNDECKQIICDSFNYLVVNKNCYILSFVIMSNHLHFMTQLIPPCTIEDLNKKFRSFTAKELIKWFRKNDHEKLINYFSYRTDRKFQIWKQKPLCVEIFSQKFMDQKTNYIHMNPVKAKIVDNPILYDWSSANFYKTKNAGRFEFLKSF